MVRVVTNFSIQWYDCLPDSIPCAILFMPVTYSFYDWKMSLIISLTYFAHSSHHLPHDTHQFVLCVYECVLFFRSHLQVKSQDVSFSVWLISVCTMPSQSIHVATKGPGLYFLEKPPVILNYGLGPSPCPGNIFCCFSLHTHQIKQHFQLRWQFSKLHSEHQKA